MDKETKLFALLSYCSVLCVVPLLKKKDDDFVLFHGRQGLALFLCEMVVFVASIILPSIMQPFLFIFGLFSLWGMFKALQGEKFKLPLIFPLSERLVL
ncbi:MAG: hypothetical protein HQL20_06430 [Candidatus Omnitrophica bacterium]|nr:hypothetical protein [Candidatus Omnitrophota bacterium]